MDRATDEEDDAISGCIRGWEIPMGRGQVGDIIVSRYAF